ncbi:MAG: hypothetical protein J5U17_08185 [Candidatus Methanoperedens sp.]|nr:hypothetical protein [Candidatus Methanoperedens sp.]
MSRKEIKLVAARTGHQNRRKNREIIWCIAFAAMLLLAPQVMARQNYLSTFETTYPAAAGSRIDACNLCHNSPEGGDARNSYGLSYASSGRNFAAIETADSDGDGWTNLQEIKSLTFPGDANDHPTTTPAPKSSGFEAIGTIAALFVVVMAIVYRQRKGKQ